MEDQHRVGAGLGEQPLALVERGQAEGRQVRLEEADRMRIEGRDQHRPALGAGARDGAAHHRLVALVKSVEIAERDDAAAKRSGTAEPPSSRSMAARYRKRRTAAMAPEEPRPRRDEAEAGRRRGSARAALAPVGRIEGAAGSCRPRRAMDLGQLDPRRRRAGTGG